ncbi:hypothetical protein H920_05639 [Fukomys damarensis]|uniref:Uncharacterized protein n=1 Tax=Fukomys damarensis TaxID=885580 RepID=A0A091DRB7_FUKDA|nr:hypothetical protein H920_05639 [Fukomys damarensis]
MEQVDGRRLGADRGADLSGLSVVVTWLLAMTIEVTQGGEYSLSGHVSCHVTKCRAKDYELHEGKVCTHPELRVPQAASWVPLTEQPDQVRENNRAFLLLLCPRRNLDIHVVPSRLG